MIKECNLCWWSVSLYNPSVIYWPRYKHHNDKWSGKSASYIYQCSSCKARVWCHGDTKKPFGTLADKETRNARHLTHELLDPIWKSESDGDHNKWSRWKARKKLYKMLSIKMWIPFKQTHMWMFTIEQCRIAYQIILDYKKNNE